MSGKSGGDSGGVGRPGSGMIGPVGSGIESGVGSFGMELMTASNPDLNPVFNRRHAVDCFDERVGYLPEVMAGNFTLELHPASLSCADDPLGERSKRSPEAGPGPLRR